MYSCCQKLCTPSYQILCICNYRLQELLKNGYANKSELYELENTALFRITPEFNLLVEKYLKDARYEIIEQ